MLSGLRRVYKMSTLVIRQILSPPTVLATFPKRDLSASSGLDQDNRLIAQIWLQQARANRRIIYLLRNSLPHASAHVCFLSQQVAELSLKAARFSLYGIDKSSCRHHALKPHAKLLERSVHAPDGTLLDLTVPLDKYYVSTRYPNCYKPQKCPAHLYGIVEATEAIQNAEEIFKIAKHLCN